MLTKVKHYGVRNGKGELTCRNCFRVSGRAQEYGTVVPSNISPGSFVQLAADNNDINEETLDRENTTHATTTVFYQKKQFGTEPPPTPLAQHGTRQRSLRTGESVIDLQECSMHGKRPTVAEYVGQVEKEKMMLRRK